MKVERLDTQVRERLDSLVLAGVRRESRGDAAEMPSVFFAREITTIKAKTYDQKYAQLMARQLIPVSYDVNAGADTFIWRSYDEVGEAQIISNYAADLPRADVRGKENFGTVKEIGSAYGYTVQDIRAALMTGMPLEQRRANSSRRSIEMKLEKIAWFGDSVNNLGGLIYNANVTAGQAPLNAGATSRAWADKTPNEILKDMNNLVNTPEILTKGQETVDTVLLPTAQYALINGTPRSKIGGDTTILKFFLDTHPGVEVRKLPLLKGLAIRPGALTSGPVDIAIAYRKDPDALQLEIPLEVTQYPVQERNLEFIVDMSMRVGGVSVYYPLSVNILTDI